MTAPVPSGSTALIDAEVLNDMRNAMRPGEFTRILEVFLADTRDRMERVTALHAAGDTARLIGECHDLSSTLGTFGAAFPMALAREAMDAARSADFPRLGRAVTQLDATTRRMTAMLHDRYLSGTADKG